VRDSKKNREKIIGVVKKLSRTRDGAQPGIAFLNKTPKTNQNLLNKFYEETLSSLVTKKEALDVARKTGVELTSFNGGRGVIGALAACGAQLSDKTFELIAYRDSKNFGKKRKINSNSVFEMNEKLYPTVFDSVDLNKNSILITPRGYDPVYCGIRGESRQSVKKAWGLIKPLERISGVYIFETNQATDAHIRRKKIKSIKPYDCVVIEGRVSSKSKTILGGHVFFKLNDGSGVIDCGAYKPTGDFRNTVRKLVAGDVVLACGGVSKYASTLNLEKFYVKKLSQVFESRPPSCCGKRMTSAGKNKGFKCRKCGKRRPTTAAKKRVVERSLQPGWFEVPPRARRHLSKPLVRMKKNPLPN